MAAEADQPAQRSASAATESRPELALTERILERLGPPRWLWILAWGLVPVASAGVVLLVVGLEGSRATLPSVFDLAISTGIGAYSVVLLLWGLDRLMAGVRALQPTPTELGGAPVAIDRRAMTNPTIPLILAAGLAALGAAETLAENGPAAEAAVLPLEFLYHIPVASFLWAYLVFLVELDRLGRHRLALDLFPQDRSLGLAPLGSVTFTGFVIVIAFLVPTTIVNATDIIAVIQILTGIALILIAFFLSMWRLHRQMSQAKARYVMAASRLYAEAYAPVRTNETLPVLEAQASVLGAAQALEQRAQGIHEWPIDEATSARLAIIVTGVVTGVIVRVLGAGLHI